MTLRIRVSMLPNGDGLPLPSYQTPGAAGCDLLAAIAEAPSVLIAPGMRALIPCGFSMEIPPGYEAQIRPRSGLALKNGVTVLNSPGTIDSDYRGEIGVILINHGADEFEVTRGMRIAQMIFAAAPQAAFEIAGNLTDTKRGAGGFGSTGSESHGKS